MKTTSKPRLHKGVTGAAITVHVIHSASMNKVDKVLPDGTIQVWLTAKRSAGEGNTALLKFLENILGVQARQLELVAGEDGADKLIAITNLDKETAHQKIMDCLKDS